MPEAERESAALELDEIHRLDQMLIEASAQSELDIALLTVARDRDQTQLRAVRPPAQSPRELVAIHDGQAPDSVGIDQEPLPRHGHHKLVAALLDERTRDLDRASDSRW